MSHILCSVIAENLVKEVNKKIFHGLVNLKTLSLYSNKISCVTPGAFDALGKNNLSEIFSLLMNSFISKVCDRWAGPFKQAGGIFFSSLLLASRNDFFVYYKKIYKLGGNFITFAWVLETLD